MGELAREKTSKWCVPGAPPPGSASSCPRPSVPLPFSRQAPEEGLKQRLESCFFRSSFHSYGSRTNIAVNASYMRTWAQRKGGRPVKSSTRKRTELPCFVTRTRLAVCWDYSDKNGGRGWPQWTSRTKRLSVRRLDNEEVHTPAPTLLVLGNFRNNKNIVNPTSAVENEVAKDDTRDREATGHFADSCRQSDTASRSSLAPRLGGGGTGRFRQGSHTAVLRGQSRLQPCQQFVTDSHPCPQQESGFDRVNLVHNSHPECGWVCISSRLRGSKIEWLR
ncbi:hypothetical protein HJG60_010364 [Phyllostomus discolor]|uniref:Uncharacterized protein n=1 Tax=Phyllostomus discolor TaxID=89673 RepID=A0A834AYK3_9CHIR|nr:hypothetical protein HJG60_010364 [Phyllostomus discolor]